MSFPPLPRWRCYQFYGEAPQVTFKFGHDFREKKLWIVDVSTGRKICEMDTVRLSQKELELAGRLIRSAPIMADVLNEAANRLYGAKHPNAVKLRQLVLNALRSLQEPLLEPELHDRIDP